MPCYRALRPEHGLAFKVLNQWFHGQLSFIQLGTRLAVELRQHMKGVELGHQRGFLGHIVVELLLDVAGSFWSQQLWPVFN